MIPGPRRVRVHARGHNLLLLLMHQSYYQQAAAACENSSDGDGCQPRTHGGMAMPDPEPLLLLCRRRGHDDAEHVQRAAAQMAQFAQVAA